MWDGAFWNIIIDYQCTFGSGWISFVTHLLCCLRSTQMWILSPLLGMTTIPAHHGVSSNHGWIHGFSCGPVKAWLVYASRMNERDKVEPLPAMKTTKTLQLNTKSKLLKSHWINPADPTDERDSYKSTSKNWKETKIVTPCRHHLYRNQSVPCLRAN